MDKAGQSEKMLLNFQLLGLHEARLAGRPIAITFSRHRVVLDLL